MVVLTIAVAIYFSGGAAALLAGYAGLGVPEERLIPWLPAEPKSALGVLYGLAMLALAPFLVMGMRAAAVLSSLLVAIITVHWMTIDPFHNVVNHLVPFFFASSAIALLSRRAEDDDRLGELVQTGARWMLGAIFTAQAWQSLSAGPFYFARRIYVEPFSESFLPEPLLYLAGLSNPWIQLIAGLMLLLGFRASWAALTAALFLLTILMGHVIRNPWDSGAEVHSYAFSNLLLAIFVVWRFGRPDPLSLDRFLSHARQRWHGSASSP